MAEHKGVTRGKPADLDQQHRMKQQESQKPSGVFHAWDQRLLPLMETPFYPRMGTDAAIMAEIPVSAQRHEFIMRLQQTYGNQYVQRLLESVRAQAKLTVGNPNDIYEQEADRVADAVTRSINSPVQRQAAKEIEKTQMQEDEEEIQTKPLPSVQKQEGDEEVIQGKPLTQRQTEEEIQMQTSDSQFSSISENLQNGIRAEQGGGYPLSDNIRKPMEQSFGADFRGVRVHIDSIADKLNKQLSARAFTTGQDIFFREGEYSPGSENSHKLIAHELAHVIQQNGDGVSRTVAQGGAGSRLSTEMSSTIQRLKKDGNEVDIDKLSYDEAHKYLIMIHEKERAAKVGEKAHPNVEYSRYDYAMLRKKIREFEKEEATVKCAEGESKFLQPNQEVDFGMITSCMTITLSLSNGWKIVAHDALQARPSKGNAVKELQDRLTVFPEATVTKIRAYDSGANWTYDMKTKDEEGKEFEQKRLNHEGIGNGNVSKFTNNLNMWFRGSSDIEYTPLEANIRVGTTGELFGKDIQEAVSVFIGEQQTPWAQGCTNYKDLLDYLKRQFPNDGQIVEKLKYLLKTTSPGLKEYVRDIPE